MFSRKRLFLALSLFALLSVPVAQAKTISFFDTFALQNSGSSSVLLLSPSQSFTSTIKTTELYFGTKLRGLIPEHGSATLLVSALVMGNTLTQSITLGPGNYVSTLQNPFIVQFGFHMPRNAYHSTPVLLTMQLVDAAGKVLETRNYSFWYIAPVPEPATLALLGMGLVGISGMALKRFRQAV